jgi:hypothetical protein
MGAFLLKTAPQVGLKLLMFASLFAPDGPHPKPKLKRATRYEKRNERSAPTQRVTG